MRTTTLCSALAAAVLATAALATGPAAQADPAPAPTAAQAKTGVRSIAESTAKDLAAGLGDRGVRSEVVRSALAGDLDLSRAALPRPLAGKVAAANRDLLAAKGLPATTPNLLRLRVGHPDMVPALRGGAAPLVAAVPGDDRAESVVGYDAAGRAHTLPVAALPSRPVLLVDIDVEAGMRAGMDVLRETLGGGGAQRVTAAGGYWATQIADVRLNDDEEPWIKGDAEIYTLVAGFGLDGKVRVDTVDMPYLNNDGTTYYPNQLLVHWNSYKYNLADAVMMEDDGSTNYRELALAVANALLTIIDGGAYTPLVTAILNALPNDWYTDDPDYVDSWYTLARESTGTRNGAGGNGRMTLRQYWVGEL